MIRTTCSEPQCLYKDALYLTLPIGFPLQRWLHERASFLRYAYRQSCSELRKQIRSSPHPFKSAKFSFALYHLPKRLFRLADTVA